MEIIFLICCLLLIFGAVAAIPTEYYQPITYVLLIVIFMFSASMVMTP